MIYLILAATLNIILSIYLGVDGIIHNKMVQAALNFGAAGFSLAILSFFLLSW